MLDIEVAFRCAELLISIIGLVFVVFGWIIPYRNSIRRETLRIKNERELEKLKWKKEFIDKQISDLYAPINAICEEGEMTFSRVLYQLGRQAVFVGENTSFDDLPENEQKIWKHYVDTYKIPAQMEIVRILKTNSHLLYKNERPKCIKYFLDYSTGWELLDNQKRNGVENYYEYHYTYNYPHQFNKYIRDTLEMLYKEQKELLHQSEIISDYKE